MEKLCEMYLGNFMYCQYMALSSTTFPNLFTRSSEIRDHNTRLSNHIHVQYRKTAPID